MQLEDYRRIFDFFFSGVEVPEELRQQFFRWLDVHGDEPKTRNLLEEYWSAAASAAPEFDITEGLEKLMARLEGDHPTGIKDNADGSSKPMQTSTGNNRNESPAGRSMQAAPRKGTPAESSGQDNRPTGRLFGSRIWKYAVVAAAAAGLFLAGAGTSELVTGSKKDTVLMASSENISSYTLPDGSKVWLNKNSWLTFNQKFGRRRRQVKLNGEGYFEVNHDESRPFIVKMEDNLEVKVLGTTFNACSYPSLNKAEVILRSGSVQVSDNNIDESVILSPDQKYTWNDGKAEVSAVNAMDCCRWFEHRLVFDNVKLKDILENLSHKYQQTIRYDIGALENKRMSMTIRDESVEGFLDVLTNLLPVRWRYQGAEIIIENKTKKH